MNLKNNKYVHLPGVFIKLHNEFEQIRHEDDWEKNSELKLKNSHFIG